VLQPDRQPEIRSKIQSLLTGPQILVSGSAGVSLMF
jgi:hypothetical protein